MAQWQVSVTSCDLELGDKVIVSSSSGSKTGLLRYLGKTEFAEGQWAGVELETPSGKNDGTVAGKRYFSCRPNYGLFAPAHKISRPARRSSQKMGVHALRRSTSRESLQSVASQASRVSAQVLKEKEEHIEQLLRERDMERSEVVRAASLVDDGEVKVLAAKREREEAHAQLQNTAEDERHRAEELQFSAEEAAIVRAELEARLHEEAALLRNELAEQRRQLEQQSAAGDSRSEEARREQRRAEDLQFNAEEQSLLRAELEAQRAEEKPAAERRADQLQTQLDTWRRDGELLKERVTALKDFADGTAGGLEKLKLELESVTQDATAIQQQQKRKLERLTEELASKEGRRRCVEAKVGEGAGAT
ncbi:CAP-Gly domain-containing linker protein 1-like [Pollicipes pollicipes]|uniref:CAP-Gly domain-containing linker protein 1-like n=1 Tax=Pollicipes pollicipes TaxID=41117 RepID=UPI0018849B89|nr:CAP-Gly domain-containing linker protein 1-like [Pollicipes pollicipes]